MTDPVNARRESLFIASVIKISLFADLSVADGEDGDFSERLIRPAWLPPDHHVEEQRELVARYERTVDAEIMDVPRGQPTRSLRARRIDARYFCGYTIGQVVWLDAPHVRGPETLARGH